MGLGKVLGVDENEKNAGLHLRCRLAREMPSPLD